MKKTNEASVRRVNEVAVDWGKKLTAFKLSTFLAPNSKLEAQTPVSMYRDGGELENLNSMA